MATCTIGYYSPPLPPGKGPEAVTLASPVDPTVETGAFRGAELQDAMRRDVLGAAEAAAGE